MTLDCSQHLAVWLVLKLPLGKEVERLWALQAAFLKDILFLRNFSSQLGQALLEDLSILWTCSCYRISQVSLNIYKFFFDAEILFIMNKVTNYLQITFQWLFQEERGPHPALVLSHLSMEAPSLQGRTVPATFAHAPFYLQNLSIPILHMKNLKCAHFSSTYTKNWKKLKFR